MKEIVVKLDYSARCWVASHYVNGESDPEVVRLFGTETVPTAFTPKAGADEVVSAIRTLNPDAHVYSVSR